MNAPEEYRKWCVNHVRESVGFNLADAAIAELEAELATVNSLLDMKREREQHWSDEAWRYKDMNEQLRAERRAS